MMENPSSFDITIALVGQFTSHGGGVGHNIVQFILAGMAWALLLWFALYRRRKKQTMVHEDLLAWGFAFGVLRETFMLTMALLHSYGIISNDFLHIFFPPIEHALLDYSMVIICGAYIRYLLEDSSLSRRFLYAGIAAVTLCYMATFYWWGNHIIDEPSLKFGQTWCDWIFRINSSIFIAIALGIICVNTRGWTRNAVCIALFLFFLHEFLKIPDMALGEVYEAQITPFRHGFYLAGIPILGYVYIREQIGLEELTEKALQHSEHLYRTLVENVDLGITLIDKNYTILMANRQIYRMAEKPPGSLVGKKCFKEFHGHEIACSHCPGTIAMQTGLPQETDSQGVRKDGSIFKVRIKAFPIMNKKGEVESFIEVVEDITERLKIEEELQQARNLESIGVLAGGIAHDFNNILASIFGFTDLARLKLDNKEGSDVRKELEQIRKGSIRARDLVQQILTISRKQQQKKKPLQISVIIKEALKLLRSTIPTTIEIKQDIHSESLVLADTTQIHQLIMNLCTNAFHALQEKGGTMAVSLDDMIIGPQGSLVGEHVLAPGKYVRLEVSDNGPGMDKSVRTRIFDPYFTTKETGKGTGLGLAVVMGIVKSHQGRISVYSEPGEGTTFSVYLPVTETETVDEVLAHEEEFHAPGNERVMVVDDEQDIRNVLKEYLVTFGYTVDLFKNGQDAWDAFERDPDKWDLLITDQTMPGITGANLVPKIREKRPNIPVILCTGYSKVINKEKIEELGINAFLHKPVIMNELLKIVHTTLSSKQPTNN
jgi:PAS domain S-box-containing protein